MPVTYEKIDAKKREQIEKVLEVARAAYHRAYQPYSKFMVGCAVLAADGRVFSGTNKETAHYLGSHAEEVSLDKMDDDGCRSPVLVASYGMLEGADRPGIIGSCGNCRQKIYEYASLSGCDVEGVVAPPGAREPRLLR